MNVRRNISSPTAAGLVVVVLGHVVLDVRCWKWSCRMNTSFGDRSFAAAAPRAGNRLPDVVHNSALSEDAFAKLLKTYLMNSMYTPRRL